MLHSFIYWTWCGRYALHCFFNQSSTLYSNNWQCIKDWKFNTIYCRLCGKKGNWNSGITSWETCLVSYTQKHNTTQLEYLEIWSSAGGMTTVIVLFILIFFPSLLCDLRVCWSPVFFLPTLHYYAMPYLTLERTWARGIRGELSKCVTTSTFLSSLTAQLATSLVSGQLSGEFGTLYIQHILKEWLVFCVISIHVPGEGGIGIHRLVDH